MVTAYSAQIRTLSTPEILEAILLQLDNQTLLTAQRTCRTWRALIYGSPSLPKALFFLPEAHCGREDEENKTQNPLLVNRFPSFFGKTKSVSLLPSLDMLKRPEKLEAYLRPEASWRSMLVQQPPILVIGLLETILGKQDSHEFYEVHVSSLTHFKVVVQHSVL
jgi:hypothetical protein